MLINTAEATKLAAVAAKAGVVPISAISPPAIADAYDLHQPPC